MEYADLDGSAQSLAREDARAQSTSGALGPAHQDQIYDAGQRASADLLPLRQPARKSSGKLCALFDERHQGGFRPMGHAFALQPARRSQSLRQGQEMTQKITNVVFDIGNVLVSWDPRNLY